MSRLIEQLIATDFQGESPRDLTLRYGQWLEQNKRDDIFLANPDFSGEYAVLKDEIARARRPGFVDEFKGSFGSAVDEMQASGYALGALVAHGAKAIGIPGAEPVRDNLLRLMKEQQAEAAEFQPSVPSYENIKNPEDVARYGTYALGTVLPSMGQAAISGIVGAALGSAVGPEGTIGGALMGLAERRLATKAVAWALEKHGARIALEEAAKALPREAIIKEAKRLAIEYGGQAALAASSVGQEIGSIYADNPEAPGAAIGYGIPAGLLDVLPEAYIASKFLGAGKRVAEEEVKKSVGYFRRFATEAAKVVPMEGSTEAAQTLLEIAAAKSGRGESPTSFTDGDYRQMLNAGIIGAIGGLGMAPVAALGGGHNRLDPNIGAIERSTSDLSARPAEITGELPDFTAQSNALSNRDLGIVRPANDVVNPMAGIGEAVAPDASFDPFQVVRPAYQSAQVFAQNETNPSPDRGVLFQGEPGSPFDVTPRQPLGPEVPKFILRAQEKVDEAIRALDTNLQEPAPPLELPAASPAATPEELAHLRPQSEVITDAPLGNLVGITVQYEGYTGTLIRDREGNFLVQRTIGDTRPVEVAGTGKDPSMMGSAVGVIPTEPPNMTPKPAPNVAILGGGTTSPIPGESKVPLGNLFPNTLPPVAGLRGDVQGAPSGPLLAQQRFGTVQPQPVAPDALPIQSPAALPLRDPSQGDEGVRVENKVVQESPGASGEASPSTGAPTAVTPDAAYDASLAEFRAASQKFDAARKAYRAKEIGDTEFLVARRQFDEAQQKADAAEKAFIEAKNAPPAPVIQPTGVVTQPTVAQVIAVGDNGVKAIPADSAPNLRRLQVFEAPRAPAPAPADGEPRAIQPVEAAAIGPNPMVELVKRVKKATKAESNVAVIVVDNATGLAYQRLVYGGPSNTVYVDMASKRKGTATGQGSTVSYEADLANGTEGRPISGARGVFAEKLATGLPRYTIYGIGELKDPGKLGNWNLGAVASLASHPGIANAAKLGWTEQATVINAAKDEMPAAPKIKNVREEAGTALLQFADEMAAWVSRHQAASEKVQARVRIDEFVKGLAKALGDTKNANSYAEAIRGQIYQKADVQLKQATLLSADYTVPTASTIDLFQSTLRALTESRQVDVVGFEQSLMGAVDAAAQTTGLVITPDGRKKIVAFGLRSIAGPINTETILSLLHETAHFVTDGLGESLRVAFQTAVEHLSWRDSTEGGRWLMNPRSLDIRLLANADPTTLSPEQRAALGTLTAEEIAAARRIDPAQLVEEQMAEHLAQLGWDKSEAKGAVQKLIRFVKDLWLRAAMAIQTALKGADNLSPALARAYVENRFLQFIHRDSALASDRINDLLNWLGVPATERQLVPIFPAGNDWDQRMQYVDVTTGQLIPSDHATYTPESQLAYLKTALDSAARFVSENPNPTDTPQFRQTRRAAFSAPMSFTPTIQTNTVFAALNLEDEIYRGIAAHEDVAPLLGPDRDFYTDWLRLPDKQLPAVRRQEAMTWASAQKDPITDGPIASKPETKVDDLPSAEEPIVDREGKPITVKLTEAQDAALQQTIAALNDTQSRVQRRINYEVDRITDLERQQKKNPADFPKAALRELDELREAVPLRRTIAAQLETQRKTLLSKFNPSALVNVYPTAEYPTIPAADATEAQIVAAPKGVVPRDYKFTDKSVLASHLSAMDAWLRNPENRNKGQIYGTVAEWYRKLNQIPVDLEIAGTAAVFRRAVTGGFGDELRHGGLRALQVLGRKIYEVADVVNTHNERMAKAGADWSTAFGDFAKSLGEQPNQGFKEHVWDPMMRIWNFIDVSERNRIGTEGEGDLFARMEGAMKNASGAEINSDKRRAALRGLLMQTIENERTIRTIYEQYPALKVHDEVMGTYRRLVSHGLVTGRRGVARHITGLFMRMNPEWSATRAIAVNAGDDQRTFWEAAGDLYKADRAAYDKEVAALFEGYTIRDFVDPLVNNNTQIFDVTDADGVTRKASLLRTRQAWSEADGDVTKFAENLHAIEGGKPGEEGLTVTNVLGAFRRMFNEIKSDQDAKNGTEASGHEILPRQMMDARIANDWPAEWVSYSTYGTSDNLGLLHQLARATAFGPDAIAGSGELASTIREAKKDLAEMYEVFDDHYRDGKSQEEIRRIMGDDEFRVAKNAAKITANLSKVEAAFRQMSSQTNYLSGDFRLLNDALGLMASSMVGNPRGAGINFIGDLLGPLVGLKLSRPALKAMGVQFRTAVADAANSVMQAFGQDSAWNVDAAKRRQAAGVTDPDLYISWREKKNNLGPGLVLSAPAGYESPGARLRRNVGRLAAQARDIIPNLGSPLQGTRPEQTLSPKLRWSVFGTSAMMTMNANIDAAYQVFTDLATRGVDYINKIPTADRAQFVRELELGVRNLDADQLGYHGGLILNDKAAFDSMRNALETKMAGEKGVGDFVAKAYRRFEGASGSPWEAIGTSQFTGIINYANTEWTLQSNFASLPPFMQSGPLRPLFIFLTWPYNAANRFKKSFLDPEGRLGRNENGKVAWWGANSTIMDGMKAFFLLAAPATIAGSFAIDWYDKYLLGKKQNLRETSLATAIPGVGAIVDPAAFIERIGRYGSAGFATDILNQIVNYDSQRNLSLDNRIVAINAVGSMINLMATAYQERGNFTYASLGRPFISTIGGAGVLQYLQIAQNLLGLNTQDAAINARINTGNYLRAAGRELNLPVAVFAGPSSVPTPVTPYLQQMELAALVNNPDLFREAYRNAVQAERDEGHRDDAEKRVAENFAERHPLKRLFKGAVSESDYRKMLGEMGDYGAGQVRAAVNSYNRYLGNWFGKKAYYGKAESNGESVEQLIRRATQINSGFEREDSLLALPR